MWSVLLCGPGEEVRRGRIIVIIMSFTHLLGHKMKLALSAVSKQVQPLLINFPDEILNRRKLFHYNDRKVIFVMGATGAGKSRLAIDLATLHDGEVINSDKMQVYTGLDVITNKVTEEECQGVPHHLLGFVNPDSDFNCIDFTHHANTAIKSIHARNRTPIIAGGSNSFIDALVNKDPEFQLRHQCCFLWVDVALPVLHAYVSKRVDRMVEAGLVDEVRKMYDPNASSNTGVRRAIGVAEMDSYLELERSRNGDSGAMKRSLDACITMIKNNTCELSLRQLQKIQRLNRMWNWSIHRIDATQVFFRQGKEADDAWERLVAGPSSMIVDRFLNFDHRYVRNPGLPTTTSIISPLAAVAAATP